MANRGEIAIRVLRGVRELGIHTIGIHSEQDGGARHRSFADECHVVGKGSGPVAAYLDVDAVVEVAVRTGADAIHPGYGFLAESPELADAAEAAGIILVGPGAATLRALGDKVSARGLASAAGVPVVPASGPLGESPESWAVVAEGLGYPLMVKASWGGGGRGMRTIAHSGELVARVSDARAEALAAFGNGEVYLERLVGAARHVEVQVLGDEYGTVVHLFDRDCSVQRRHQKVIELAPAAYLDDRTRRAMCRDAVALVASVGYVGAGTVEFLYDEPRGTWYFIEVNPRIQVEHTVTEAVTGIDIVRAQIGIARGGRIGQVDETGVPDQADIVLRGCALQCRVTTEDPAKGFAPGSGTVTAHRAPTGPGVRVDAGTVYSGAEVSPHYDSLLEKVTVWAPSRDAAVRRAVQALDELVITGVPTNVGFLTAVLGHEAFRRDAVTTRFVDEHLEALTEPQPDAIGQLLDYLAWVRLNRHPDLDGRPASLLAAAAVAVPPPPLAISPEAPVAGSKQLLDEIGPRRFAAWMRDQRRVLVTDTTFRDAHQSLLATRVRTHDLVSAAPAVAERLPGLLSLECWGGATFDVAMRFLHEDPWERLVQIRGAVPNLALQMLIRGPNAVGYTSYPDNAVRHVIGQAAEAGIDVFRVFDSLNLVDNMAVAIDAVLEAGRLCEGAICYSGDLNDATRPTYDLSYYLRLAEQIVAAGCHVLAIKDMAGICRPDAAHTLVEALRDRFDIPVHFHTHDTSGYAGASVLAAVDAGVDAVDVAIDAMSGLTSQAAMGSLVRCLEHGERATALDPGAIAELSGWWEQTRRLYAPFESDMRAGTGDVYRHEMPGGQYTNLREQARGLGIDDGRWSEVTDAYATVNQLFGDIPKVTPTSKVVGDLALLMVTQGLSGHDIADPSVPVAFPESVVGLFRGDLGIPHGGFPAALQRKVLGHREARTTRPGSDLAPADLDPERMGLASSRQVASRTMHPTVFDDLRATTARWGDLSVLPTDLFFFGLAPGRVVPVVLGHGREVLLSCDGTLGPDADGVVTFVFRVDGEQRPVQAQAERDVGASAAGHQPVPRPQGDPDDPTHVMAPFDALVLAVKIAIGDRVKAGDPLCLIEAMKMQTTIAATTAGEVEMTYVEVGERVQAGDLIAVVRVSG